VTPTSVAPGAKPEGEAKKKVKVNKDGSIEEVRRDGERL